MKSFVRSVGYAVSGIVEAFRTQRNMRIHGVAALLAIAAGMTVSLNAVEWCVILITIALVIGLELVNTALEHAVDLASPERRPLARSAKDAAAGAVLVAALMSVAIGLIILGPPLWRLLFG